MGDLNGCIRQLHRCQRVECHQLAVSNRDRQLIEIVRAVLPASLRHEYQVNAFPLPLIVGNLDAVDQCVDSEPQVAARHA